MENERFVRVRNVIDLTGLSKAHIYRLMSEGAFPRPYKLSTRAVGWKLSDIEDWLASREQVAG